jgi:hypothetical protein
MNDRISTPRVTWVLITLLLMLTEYVLIGWTQNYGADRDVLSHVGFAGTIVSMILGVVAIIYAFYQGFAQQRDSQALATQLSELRTVADGLRAAGSSISNSGAALQDLRETLQQTLQISRSTHDALESFKQHQSQPVPAVAAQVGGLTPPDHLDLDRLASHLVRRAAPSQTQLAIYEALCYAGEKTLTLREYATLVGEATEKRLTARGDANIAQSLGNWLDGIATGYQDVLFDAGLTKTRPGPTAERRWVIEVTPEFARHVKQATDAVTESTPSELLDVPYIKQVIKDRETRARGA